jgi:hypothetical protein
MASNDEEWGIGELNLGYAWERGRERKRNKQSGREMGKGRILTGKQWRMNTSVVRGNNWPTQRRQRPLLLSVGPSVGPPAGCSPALAIVTLAPAESSQSHYTCGVRNIQYSKC